VSRKGGRGEDCPDWEESRRSTRGSMGTRDFKGSLRVTGWGSDWCGSIERDEEILGEAPGGSRSGSVFSEQ
jgi:hypothetical protein